LSVYFKFSKITLKCLGCTAKIIISEFLTASSLSEVKITLLYLLNFIMELVFLFVKYKESTTLFVNNPFAIDCPKLPAPIIATFIIILFFIPSKEEISFIFLALPLGSRFTLQVLVRSSLWAFHCNH